MQINSETAKFLGLDKYEQVILNSMNKERILISEISKMTKIPRTSLYYILPRLIDRGFLEKRKIGTKTYWRKTSQKEYLENYQKIISEKEINLAVNNQNKTKIVYGTDQLMKTLFSLAEVEPRERWCGIQPKSSIDTLLKKIDINKLNELNELIKERKIIVEGVVHEDYMDIVSLEKDKLKSLLRSFKGRTIDYAKLPKDYLANTKAEIYLWQNKIALMNWDKEFAVVIEDDDCFELIKAMFDSTKYMLDKYDQNEKFARKLVELA